jgi:uncharacterized protein YrzB (UPF0473 family)
MDANILLQKRYTKISNLCYNIFIKEYKEVNPMKEKETIIVIDKDGKEREAEVLSVFELEKFHKDYILYTFNEKNENDMVKIYASTLIEKEDMYSFEAISTPEEWAAIKDLMRQMAQAGKTE